MATAETVSACKSALVLSGGGAYGAYEVGVIRALIEGRSASTARTPLDADIFTGTSVGSFNAALLAMNKGTPRESAARLHSIWTDEVADNSDGRGNGVYRLRGNPVDYLDPRLPGSPIQQLQRIIADAASLGRAVAPRLLNLLAPEGGLIERIEGFVDVSVFLNTDAFERLVEEWIEPSAIRESGKVLSVTATGWWTGDAQDFDFPSMTDEETWLAIRASAAIPGLFAPVKIWKEVFVDGGVVLNTPIRPAVDEGADTIHVVTLNPKMMSIPQDHLANTVDTFSRVYAAMLTTKILEDIESARWVNDGIDVLERVEAGEDVNSETMRRFARVAGVIARKLRRDGKFPRKLTVHVYYPSKRIGDLPGMLNFRRDAIDSLIEDGYADTCVHDCKANGCVIPAASAGTEPGRSLGAAGAS